MQYPRLFCVSKNPGGQETETLREDTLDELGYQVFASSQNIWAFSEAYDGQPISLDFDNTVQYFNSSTS